MSFICTFIIFLYKFYYVLVYLTINDKKKKKNNSQYDSHYENYSLRPVEVGRFDGVLFFLRKSI